MPIVLKSGSVDLLEHSGPAQACNGIGIRFKIQTLDRLFRNLVSVLNVLSPHPHFETRYIAESHSCDSRAMAILLVQQFRLVYNHFPFCHICLCSVAALCWEGVVPQAWLPWAQNSRHWSQTAHSSYMDFLHCRKESQCHILCMLETCYSNC